MHFCLHTWLCVHCRLSGCIPIGTLHALNLPCSVSCSPAATLPAGKHVLPHPCVNAQIQAAVNLHNGEDECLWLSTWCNSPAAAWALQLFWCFPITHNHSQNAAEPHTGRQLAQFVRTLAPAMSSVVRYLIYRKRHERAHYDCEAVAFSQRRQLEGHGLATTCRRPAGI
jgi:hypothetical protein